MPKNLLVADPSLTMRKVIAMVLSTEDCQITAVDNGSEAIAKARELKPDAVLADVAMPGKNGYEVCEALKSDPSTQGIPVLLLARNSEAFDEHRARAAQATDHLVKPFESQSLIDKVRALLGLAKGAQDVPRAAAAPPPRPPAPSNASGLPEPHAAPVPQNLPPPAPARPSPPASMSGLPRPGSSMPPAGFIPPRPGVSPAPHPGMASRPMVHPASAPPPVRAAGPIPPGPLPRPGVPPPGVPPARMPGFVPPRSGMPPPGMVPPVRAVAPPGAAPGFVPPAVPPGMIPRGRDPFGLGTPAPSRGADGGEALLREALSKASREVIEKIAWEVVPQLAETIIREQLERLMKERESKS